MVLLAKQSLDEAPYKLSGAVAKLASIAGAKLTWESAVDVGASSSSIPGNGARKLA
jgi:hypothetical protein